MGKQWKEYERRAARFFGTERTPLSGINSRHDTTSDTLHPRLYIECKSAAGPTGSNGYIWRWLRSRQWTNGLVVTRTQRGRSLYLVHSGSLLFHGWVVGVNLSWVAKATPRPAARLMADVRSAAAKEHKTPLLALFCKGKRGFWLVGEAGAILKAIEVRKAVIAGGVEGK